MNAPNVVPKPPTLKRGTRTRYDAIVIGSGTGGAVSAAGLAARGLSVLVMEKNPRLGGILASRWRDGFKLDMGSHLVSRGDHGPFGHVFRQLGIERPRFITHPIPVRSRGMFEIAAPTHRHELPAYAFEAARKLALPAKDVARVGRMLFQVLTLSEWELTRWDRRTLDEFIREHTEHPGAYFLFSFLASIFFVLPPWRVSAGEAIRCLRWVLRAYRLSYVEGGMDSIPHALLGFVPRSGGEILVGQRAVAIRHHRDALLVATDDGSEHIAPLVVADVGPGDLLGLLDELDVPDDWFERVSAIEGSGNAHQIKLALRRPLVDEGCLIGGVSLEGKTLEDLSFDLMADTVADIDVGRISDPLAIYAPVPSNYDPNVAPPGAQLIVASIYGPTTDSPVDAPDAWRERILDAFARVIPGLRDELLFHEFEPVPSVGRWMGKQSRAAISNGQLPFQVGRDRLSVVTPIRGLYLAGDGAGGRGIGTELAVESALEALAAIELSRRNRPRPPPPTFHWSEAA